MGDYKREMADEGRAHRRNGIFSEERTKICEGGGKTDIKMMSKLTMGRRNAHADGSLLLFDLGKEFLRMRTDLH